MTGVMGRMSAEGEPRALMGMGALFGRTLEAEMSSSESEAEPDDGAGLGWMSGPASYAKRSKGPESAEGVGGDPARG